jgi:hypothetical protein
MLEGKNVDRFWMATLSGLIAYEGFVKKPEMSFNIEDTWEESIKLSLILFK